MKTLLAALLLILTCIAQAETIPTPAPLWESRVAVRRAVPPNYWTYARIAAATSDVVFIVAEPGTVSALDARTGRTLWQRGPTPPDRQREDSDNTLWNVLGTATATRTQTVVVLTQTINSTVPVGTEKSQPLPPIHFYLVGIAANSNRVLWRSKDYVHEPYQPRELRHGVVIVPAPVQELPAKQGEYNKHREYLDARTGTPLNLNTAQGRAHMQRLLAVNGGSILEDNGSHGGTILENPVCPVWVRAETGTSELLPLPSVGAGYIFPEVTRNGIIISRVNTDDDMTGHSSWPVYLLGSDLKGRRLWQFPAKIQWSKDNPDIAAAPESRIRNVIAIPGTDLVLAENDAGGIYGLDVRDGKAAWQLPAQPFHLAPISNSYYNIVMQPSATYRVGCFGYMPQSWQDSKRPVAASVVYISARAGKTLPVLSGSPVQQVAVEGETLFVQTATDTFRAYSIPALLTPRRQQESAAKLKSADTQRAVLLRRIVADYPHLLWYHGRRIVLREQQGAKRSAPHVQFLPQDEETWLIYNAVYPPRWDEQHVYASTPEGVTAWNRTTGKAAWTWLHARTAGNRSLIVVGDGRVFVDDRERIIHCLKATTGHELWRLAYATANPDPASPDPQEAGANAAQKRIFCLPLAFFAGRVYLTRTENRFHNYHLVEVDAQTGHILRQTQPQPSDDLIYYLTNFANLPGSQGFYAMQQEIGIGQNGNLSREYFTLLVLNKDLNLAWKKRIHSVRQAGNIFVCAMGQPQEGILDPENFKEPGDKAASTILVGLNSVGHEQWRRTLGKSVWPAGTWKGNVVVLHSDIQQWFSGTRDTTLHLSGIRPNDGKVLWSLHVTNKDLQGDKAVRQRGAGKKR